MTRKYGDKNSAELPKDVFFFQLFMESQKNLYAYILASIHNYADADDILQETATEMWRKFDQFERGTSFIAWGISIARNLIRNYFNSRKDSRFHFDDDLAQTIEEITLLEFDHKQIRLEALKKCYNQLSEFNQAMIKLRYNEGLTIKTIASRLGKPIQGIYKRMSRLHDSLLRCIEERMAVNEELL
jgi:RNA polymerase sigma-70 factor (ECF subfamily)